MKKALFIACLAIVWCCQRIFTLPALAEAPLGDWRVQGQNPGDTRPYKGQVSVIQSGETYTVLWRFGGTTYIGTGLELGNHFAVTFKPSESMIVGLLLLEKKEGAWRGKWTQMGGKTVGIETWQSLSTQTP